MEELRNKLNEIDDEIVKLYLRRMEIVAHIAREKILKGLPIENEKREKEILERVTAGVTSEVKKYLLSLFEIIFETSKEYQTELKKSNS